MKHHSENLDTSGTKGLPCNIYIMEFWVGWQLIINPKIISMAQSGAMKIRKTIAQ